VFLPGPSAPVSYVTRGDRRIMLVPRPGPAIESSHLLGIESILPIQFVSPTPRTGERALLARVLVEALGDVGLLAGGRWRRRPPPLPRQELATRWLLGELDGQVALPVRLVCDALGLSSTRLAAAVTRARAARSAAGPARRRAPTARRLKRRVLPDGPLDSEATPRSISLASTRASA
jgi:hypothetical protein